MRIIQHIRFSCFLGLMACIAGTVDARVRTYQADTGNFPNPERGFYIQADVSLNGLQQARTNQGITVIRTYYRIDSYRNADLPQSVLDKFSSDLGVVRQAGAKIIPRFSYNFAMGDPDAPLSQILRHIEQIRPILQANHDVIAFMEAGFIGAWGEWHHSTNGLDNVTPRTQILFALLSALPRDRMVALRYNYHKREIYGTDTPLGPDSAFCGSNRARTGAHNDCLGAAADDWGTYYPTSASDITWQKNYLNLDNRYLPQGGETCNPNSPYSDCPAMLADLARMRWDVLNIDYHTDVLNSWVSGGCMNQVKTNLGYRIRLIRATLPDTVFQNGTLAGELVLVNAGWGKLYNPRGIELVLRKSGATEKVVVPLTADPRRWLAGDTARVQFSVPAAPVQPNTRYDLLLNLPDTCAQLRDKPAYSIRCANTGTWEASTGYNSLQHTVTVAPPTRIGPRRSGRNGASSMGRADLLYMQTEGAAVRVHDLSGRILACAGDMPGPGVYLLAGADGAVRKAAVTAAR